MNLENMGKRFTIDAFLGELQKLSAYDGFGYYCEENGNRVRYVHFNSHAVKRYVKAHPEITHVMWYDK